MLILIALSLGLLARAVVLTRRYSRSFGSRPVQVPSILQRFYDAAAVGAFAVFALLFACMAFPDKMAVAYIAIFPIALLLWGRGCRWVLSGGGPLKQEDRNQTCVVF